MSAINVDKLRINLDLTLIGLLRSSNNYIRDSKQLLREG